MRNVFRDEWPSRKGENGIRRYRKSGRSGLTSEDQYGRSKRKNEQDIISMAQYFKEKQHILRFIEYMDVGNSNGWRLDEVVSKKEIIDQVHQLSPLHPVAPNYKGKWLLVINTRMLKVKLA